MEANTILSTKDITQLLNYIEILKIINNPLMTDAKEEIDILILKLAVGELKLTHDAFLKYIQVIKTNYTISLPSSANFYTM